MKIHVMRNKLTVDVVVDPTNPDSIMHAADVLNSIHRHATGQDHTTLEITDSRLVRVDAPEPAPEASEPAADDLGDMPEHLKRTAKAEAAE